VGRGGRGGRRALGGGGGGGGGQRPAGVPCVRKLASAAGLVVGAFGHVPARVRPLPFLFYARLRGLFCLRLLFYARLRGLFLFEAFVLCPLEWPLKGFPSSFPSSFTVPYPPLSQPPLSSLILPFPILLLPRNHAVCVCREEKKTCCERCALGSRRNIVYSRRCAMCVAMCWCGVYWN